MHPLSKVLLQELRDLHQYGMELRRRKLDWMKRHSGSYDTGSYTSPTRSPEYESIRDYLRSPEGQALLYRAVYDAARNALQDGELKLSKKFKTDL